MSVFSFFTSAVESSHNFYRIGKLLDILYSVFELFFPKACASCLAYGQCMSWSRGLCNRCDYLLRYSLVKVFRPPSRYQNPQVFTTGIYTHEVAKCVLAFKNGGRTDLLPYFSDGLVRSTLALLHEQVGAGRIVVVPIPSTVRSSHRRGFVPAELLGIEIVRRMRRMGENQGLNLRLSRILKQKQVFSPTSGQKKLGVAARRRRTKNSITLRKSLLEYCGFERNLEGMKCILVDDVLTTGATLKAAFDVLESKGAHVLGAVTIAAVPRRVSPEITE